MSSPATCPPLLAPPLLYAVLVSCGSGSAATMTLPGSTSLGPVSPNLSPSPAPAPVGGPLARTYGCLLPTCIYPNGYPTPTHLPSALGTMVIRPGSAYSVLAGSGIYTFDAARSCVTCDGGPFDRVGVSYDHLQRTTSRFCVSARWSARAGPDCRLSGDGRGHEQLR
jgi:hypothetical protein